MKCPECGKQGLSNKKSVEMHILRKHRGMGNRHEKRVSLEHEEVHAAVEESAPELLPQPMARTLGELMNRDSAEMISIPKFERESGKRYDCPRCGKNYAANYIGTHLRDVHNIWRRSPNKNSRAAALKDKTKSNGKAPSIHEHLPEVSPAGQENVAVRIQALLQLGEMIAGMKG